MIEILAAAAIGGAILILAGIGGVTVFAVVVEHVSDLYGLSKIRKAAKQAAMEKEQAPA